MHFNILFHSHISTNIFKQQFSIFTHTNQTGLNVLNTYQELTQEARKLRAKKKNRTPQLINTLNK